MAAVPLDGAAAADVRGSAAVVSAVITVGVHVIARTACRWLMGRAAAAGAVV